MKYEFITDEQRKDARESRKQELQNQALALEQQHFALELDYRIANRLNPPDEARKQRARDAQASLDADYAVVVADLNTFK